MIHTFISLSLTTKMAIPCRVCVCVYHSMGERQTWLDAEVEKVLEQKNALAVLQKVRHMHNLSLH